MIEVDVSAGANIFCDETASFWILKDSVFLPFLKRVHF